MENVDYRHLGERIREERLHLRLTQAQLAEDIDIMAAPECPDEVDIVHGKDIWETDKELYENGFPTILSK